MITHVPWFWGQAGHLYSPTPQHKYTPQRNPNKPTIYYFLFRTGSTNYLKTPLSASTIRCRRTKKRFWYSCPVTKTRPSPTNCAICVFIDWASISSLLKGPRACPGKGLCLKELDTEQLSNAGIAWKSHTVQKQTFSFLRKRDTQSYLTNKW